jgi:hypothetical protein
VWGASITSPAPYPTKGGGSKKWLATGTSVLGIQLRGCSAGSVTA